MVNTFFFEISPGNKINSSTKFISREPTKSLDILSLSRTFIIKFKPFFIYFNSN